ncbi:nitrate- and nitrite sensing domain-containing protein [Nocardia sp. NBC_01730]|uniref:sensor histidine kinase n=1 Tax=Nocardia sp. NBC_01730 TaxID=2975998 RepID=UPI002E122266|nr:nitrate- and nitrite sensing domain-containing protein [Nocardia sp. NBC_01730]
MFRRRLGVRGRILAIALIPSLTLLLVGVGTAGYLVFKGAYARVWAIQVQKSTPSAREFTESVQLERRLTLAELAGDHDAAPALAAARVRVDKAVAELRSASGGLQTLASSLIGEKVTHFLNVLDRLPTVRAQVDTGALPILEAYAFYNDGLRAIPTATQIAQQFSPDPEIAIELAEGLRLFYAAEAMSRSNALAMALVNAHDQATVPVAEYLSQVGYYHAQIDYLTSEFDAPQRDAAKAATASPAWRQLTSMEDTLTRRALQSPPDDGQNTTTSDNMELPWSVADWQNAATDVNRGLIDIWINQNKQAQKVAEDKAGGSALSSLLFGIGVLLVAIAGFIIAVKLANRIIRRLKLLRRETLALADEGLPDMMRRLRTGEPVDPAEETPLLDYGEDEIGQVAKAFGRAHAAAVAGAVTEARTREGVKAVFLNIAHRSQIVVHQQLEILDEAERGQEDPALLDTFFRLDHLATRERRNAENLVILGGGQPGRQWRNPVDLIALVRSAIGETLDYSRVRLARQPETQIVGSAVADLIHLLAELIDNATSFSPPQSRVEVSGNVVGKGVVVEIEDQGMGMPADELTKTNDMLRNPPDFGVAALSADSRLGLFVVAQLGVRYGVSVRLVESDYGGIRAIVLIPSALIARETGTPTPRSEVSGATPSRAAAPPPVHQSPMTLAEQSEAPVATLVAKPAAADPTPSEAVTAAPTGNVDARPVLPRRNRQANLAPQLSEPAATPTGPQRQRTAEQARDLMSAIENGTRQGRKPLSDDNPTPDDQKD